MAASACFFCRTVYLHTLADAKGEILGCWQQDVLAEVGRNSPTLIRREELREYHFVDESMDETIDRVVYRGWHVWDSEGGGVRAVVVS